MNASKQPPTSVAAPAIGLTGGVVALLAGGWLMFAPFALGYQAADADWTDATTTGFFTGVGVAAASLLVIAALATQLAGRLRALTAPARQADPPASKAPVPTAPGASETQPELPEQGQQPRATHAAEAERPPEADQPPEGTPASRPAQSAQRVTSPADTSEVATVLAPLVEALMHDLSGAGERQGVEQASGNYPAAAPTSTPSGTRSNGGDRA